MAPYFGPDEFTYRVTDGDLYSEYVTVTIDVEPSPQIASLLVLIVGGIVTYLNPSMNPTVQLFVWLVPACCLLGAMIWAWHSSAYELYREVCQKRGMAEKRAEELLGQLDTKPPSKGEVLSAFRQFCKEGPLQPVAD